MSNTVNPNDIRFSQSSVNGSAEIVESMRNNGFIGKFTVFRVRQKRIARNIGRITECVAADIKNVYAAGAKISVAIKRI